MNRRLITAATLAGIAGFTVGLLAGLLYEPDRRCFEDEVVISWHVGYTCEPLDNLPTGLQVRIESRQ